MAEQASNDTTIIGADSHFKGELHFERTARINGRFDGQITGQGELHVSENAACQADVDAGSVHVDGNVEGNLRAKDAVRLNNNGVVKGDITAAKMVMAEGASFFGHCAVGPDALKQGAQGAQKGGGQQAQQSGGEGKPGDSKGNEGKGGEQQRK